MCAYSLVENMDKLKIKKEVKNDSKYWKCKRARREKIY